MASARLLAKMMTPLGRGFHPLAMPTIKPSKKMPKKLPPKWAKVYFLTQNPQKLWFLEVKNGVYMCQFGPCYETVAEMRLGLAAGCDALGMSTGMKLKYGF